MLTYEVKYYNFDVKLIGNLHDNYNNALAEYYQSLLQLENNTLPIELKYTTCILLMNNITDTILFKGEL